MLIRLVNSILLLALLIILGCEPPETISEKKESRNFPSIFQAWYPVDKPYNSLEEKIQEVAKHDLIWEEPISQALEGYEVLFNVEWNHQYPGLASNLTISSIKKAKETKKEITKINPNQIILHELRWRDAPQSFLPMGSDFWLKDEKGNRIEGWQGGSEPFFFLNHKNPDFQKLLAKKAKSIVSSGIFDGIIMDWAGDLEVVQKVRKAIGPDKILIVNIHDDIKKGELYKDYINGAFMELNPIDYGVPQYNNRRNWDKVREALVWFEKNLKKPTINCMSVNGYRDDLARMRAATTLGLVYSNGYQLYTDYNPLPTPDHLHNWYPFWDTELGRPTSDFMEFDDGSARRIFENGTVVYNHYKNNPIVIQFDTPKKRVSTGKIDKIFTMKDRDGDIFLNLGKTH